MLTIVPPHHSKRREVEQFIRRIYADEYGAEIAALPETLVVALTPGGSVACAAGLRRATDGFFSESYLDEPIEQALGQLADPGLSRSAIFEVSCLVSEDPHLVSEFVLDIVSWGCRNGYLWSFFTVTRRLEVLLKRMGLSPVHLCRADPARLSDSKLWGNYYLTDPRVVAVAHHTACEILALEA